MLCNIDLFIQIVTVLAVGFILCFMQELSQSKHLFSHGAIVLLLMASIRC